MGSIESWPLHLACSCESNGLRATPRLTPASMQPEQLNITKSATWDDSSPPAHQTRAKSYLRYLPPLRRNVSRRLATVGCTAFFHPSPFRGWARLWPRIGTSLTVPLSLHAEEFPSIPKRNFDRDALPTSEYCLHRAVEAISTNSVTKRNHGVSTRRP